MAIGRAEDRDTPWDPVMFNIARMFRSPIRVTHLGQRSDRPHTQAGHMTAIDQTCFSCIKSLHARGPSTHGSRLSPGRDLGNELDYTTRRRARLRRLRAEDQAFL